MSEDELAAKVREAVEAELADLEEKLVGIAQEEIAKFAAELATRLDALDRVQVSTNGDVQIIVTLPSLTAALNELAAKTGSTPGA